MFICNSCGAVFEEAEGKANYEYYGSAPYVESFDDVCPECGSDNIDDGAKCCICGNIFNEDETTRIDDVYFDDNEDKFVCAKCFKKLQNEYDNWLNSHEDKERGIIDAYVREDY